MFRRAFFLPVLLFPAPGDGALTQAALREELNRPIPAYFVAGPEGAEMWARLSDFYASRGDRPLWRTPSGERRTAQLEQWLATAPAHGLDPAHYRIEASGQPAPANPVLRTVWEAEQEVASTHALWRLAAHLSRGRVEPRETGWPVPRRPLPAAVDIAAALDSGDVESWLSDLPPGHDRYRRLLVALAEYRGIVAAGGWPALAPEGAFLKTGSPAPEVATLRRLLQATGDLETAAEGGRFDSRLEAAVRRFQRRHGLEEDGVVGPAFRAAAQVTARQRLEQLKLSLERWRWLPRDLGERYLFVNAAAARLTAVIEGAEILSMRAVVGEVEHPTRLFSDRLEKVVLWPSWNVPRGLARRKVLPKARAEPGSLTRDGFEVFTLDWRRVDAEKIDWRRVDEATLPYHFRQRSGFRNALGRLTIEFPNPYNIYIHDTPEKHLFGDDQRLYSAGCVRVEKPLELAALVLGGEWLPEDVERALAPGRTQEIAVADPWAVHLVYFTAWVDEAGELHFRDDPYGLDAALEGLLARRFVSR